MTSAPPIIVACDLDRTLIYSANSMALDMADSDAPPMVVSEVYQGVPLSFMTATAERMLESLAARTVFVPVTTRTVAQYQRVRLPGPTPGFAITTNGGVILLDGQPDTSWGADIARRSATECASLAEIERLVAAGDQMRPWILRVAHAEELFCYAIVDREAMPEQYLEDLRRECEARGWSVSVQWRKLYCIPNPVNKAVAIEEVRRRTGSTVVLAAGDSLLDRDMLRQATRAFRPRHGELDDAGYLADNLTITTARGIRAGEELLERLCAEAAKQSAGFTRA